ncbi:MAG: hypothetical protein ACRDWI_04320 [Jiangellaceae bacterium]
MSGWGTAVDDLAKAVSQLLVVGPTQVERLADPAAVVGARNVVLAEARALIGAVTETPLRPARDVTAQEMADHPATALVAALGRLPAANGATPSPAATPLHSAATPVERLWHDAARACIALEAYSGAMGRLPDDVAWKVVRDLSDIAAALSYLDGDLAELLPSDHPASAMLAEGGGQGVLRVAAVEAQARIDHHLAGAMPPDPEHRRGIGGTRLPAPNGVHELAAVTRHLAAVMAHRSSDLSIDEVKAVARLLHGGFDNVAAILERPPAASDDWKRAAAALRAGLPAFDRLRRPPAATLLPATLAIPTVLRSIRVQLDALLGVAHRLPADAPIDQWQRLAEPAVAWVAATPALINATAASLHAAIGAGKILVPADPQPDRADLQWVPVRPGHAGAQELLGRAASAVREARNSARALPRFGHLDAPFAAGTIRLRAGHARAELQTVLRGRVTPLPSHPRDDLPRRPGRSR